MKQLITRVLVTVMIDGQRQDIPPGNPLPGGVHEHDVAQLLRMRAIEDPDATAAAEKDAAKKAAADNADYAAARKAVQAEQASIEAAGPATESAANTAPESLPAAAKAKSGKKG